jgi:hypothetical protein
MNLIISKIPILCSSSLFIVPCIYGTYKEKYSCSLVSLLSMSASILYWIYPITGFRRNIDLSVSKFTGIYFFMYGYHNIRNNIMRIFGYANISMILIFYGLSCYFYSIHSEYWVYCHLAFHIFTVIGKMVVIS